MTVAGMKSGPGAPVARCPPAALTCRPLDAPLQLVTLILRVYAGRNIMIFVCVEIFFYILYNIFEIGLRLFVRIPIILMFLVMAS